MRTRARQIDIFKHFLAINITKMADKVKLLELDIDVESIISKSAMLKTNLDQLREKQDALKKSGDTSSETYIKNAAAIGKVSSEYRLNQQQLSNLATVNSKYLTVQDKINLAIDNEVRSVSEARQNNSELLKIRNELNLKTGDGAKAAGLINAKLDENNAFIKENVSAYEKQKINIGNYTDGIKEALNETGFFSGVLGDLSKVGSSVSGVFGLLKKDFAESYRLIRNSAKGTEDLTGAKKAYAVATNIATGATRILALALGALGIGAIIAAIALLIGYFRTVDPLIDKIEQGMAALGASVRVVQQALAGLLSGDLSGFDNLTGKMREAAKAAADLKEAQQDLADAQAIQSVANKRQEAEIARLMLQAKDRGKSEEERIALLQKAEAINQQNFKKNEALANQEMANAIENARIKGQLSENEIGYLQKQGLAYAYKLLNVGKITDEEVEMLKKAEEAKLDIYNRATAEQEKIQNRTNALIEKAQAEAEARAKKAEEARQKALDSAATKAKSELDYFLSTQGIRAKSMQEELAIAEKVRDKKLEIAKKEYEASEKTEADKLKLLTDQNNIKDEFLQKQVDATIANAQRELDQYIKNNQSKLDNDKYFSEESLRIEQERLQGISDKKKAFLDLELEQGKLSQQAYNDAINAINEENRVANETAKLERDAAQRETDLLNAQNQIILDEQSYNDKWALETARLKRKKDAEIANAKAINADVNLIEKIYAKYQENIDRDKWQAKLDFAASTFGAVADMLGRESELGKAAAIAQGLINVAQGVTKAIADGGLAGIATGALVAISGGTSIVKMMNTKPPEKPAKPTVTKLRRGGILTGKKHEFGGIPLGGGYEGEDGEAVMNAKTTKMFTPLLSALNVAGGGVSFGGVYPDYAANGFGSGREIDYDKLAQEIGEQVAIANANLPKPQVSLSLEEFHLANDQYLNTIKAADF